MTLQLVDLVFYRHHLSAIKPDVHLEKIFGNLSRTDNVSCFVG